MTETKKSKGTQRNVLLPLRKRDWGFLPGGGGGTNGGGRRGLTARMQPCNCQKLERFFDSDKMYSGGRASCPNVSKKSGG